MLKYLKKGNSLVFLKNTVKSSVMKGSLAHTVGEFKCHIVWVSKKRRKVIQGRLRQEIEAILMWLCEYLRKTGRS